MQKNYSTTKAECLREIKKKKRKRKKKEMWSGLPPTWRFPFSFNLSKIYSTEFFISFPVSSFISKIEIFRKNVGSPA